MNWIFPLIICYIIRESEVSKGMRTFNYSALKDQKWDSEILGTLQEFTGMPASRNSHLKQRPQELEKLVEIAKIQSTEASNAIEGIVTTSTRIKQLVEEKPHPRIAMSRKLPGIVMC